MSLPAVTYDAVDDKRCDLQARDAGVRPTPARRLATIGGRDLFERREALAARVVVVGGPVIGQPMRCRDSAAQIAAVVKILCIESELQRELHDTRIAAVDGRPLDLAEACAVERHDRRIEVDVVDDVERSHRNCTL